MTLQGLRALFGTLVVAALAMTLSNTAHAQGIYLDFQVDVPGDATATGFEDWIEITSLGNEVTRASAIAKPQFSEITLTKRTDRSSPLLWRSAILGTNRGEARLVVVDDDGDVLFEIRADNAILMSYSFGTAGGAASEQLTLSFTRISFAYTPPDGGGVVVTCWNVAMETSC